MLDLKAQRRLAAATILGYFLFDAFLFLILISRLGVVLAQTTTTTLPTTTTMIFLPEWQIRLGVGLTGMTLLGLCGVMGLVKYRSHGLTEGFRWLFIMGILGFGFFVAWIAW